MDVQPKQATAKGPAEWFTGDVWIDPVAAAPGLNVAAVHFTPGARSAWHSHSTGQTLYVTEGEGRVQPRGEAAVVIRAGDSLYAPPGEWHWHGAAPGRFMTHLSMTGGDATWGDHVTDEEYRGG
jgi:quercetin dioxygenase-like cupin family protein